MALHLEDFDAPFASVTTAPSSEPNFDDGYAKGLADARAAAKAEQQEALNTIAQSLSDIDISYAQARAEVLGALAPLFATLLDRIAPELARKGLLAQLHAHICEAMEADTAQAIELSLSEEDHVLLTAQLAGATGAALQMRATDDLRPGQAVLVQNGEETAFDTPRVLNEITDIFAAMTEPHQEKAIHGI